ncbi:MAG: hypothetical protein A2270_07610 [Elusimicrobia bacterium RIFOXYA12_FULL_51_18]|nr:MAG: hypothetical protein A2270_07610 [Elusimicrobia bacterium RIFOXYA12_FULL_51_18]OGS29932.1 MAG: hypothetical protein A2218_12280 [Elusimicrobia bacterium RIFOXYA2_FULL_53_38]
MPEKRGHKGLASLIIPVYNALPHLKKCVESAVKTADWPYELILVDNASGLPTRKYIKSLPKAVKIFNPANYGFAKAVNQGIKAAKGEFIVLVNSDLVFYEGWLEGLIRCLTASRDIGAAGPMTNRTVGVQRIILAPKIERNPRALELFAGAMQLKFKGKHFDVHRLVGFCVALKREVVERIGLLDERFGTGCFEDLDYSLRIRQAGWRLAAAKDVFVRHHHHASFAGHDHFHDWAVKNRQVFIDKWCRKALEFLDEIDPYLEPRSIKMLEKY